MSIDDPLEEDDDGGPTTPTFSTVARLIPLEPPRLPTPSAPKPDAPARKDRPPSDKHKDDDDDEDGFDDDGGIRPPSFSTVARIIPLEPPRLSSIQHSSPPPVPQRADHPSDEEEDDDGGMGSSKSKKPKAKPTKDKGKKPKRQSDDDDEDEDGGVRAPSISTISKAIPKQAPRLTAPVTFQAAPRPALLQSSVPLASSSNPVQRLAAPRPALLQRSVPPPPPRQDIAAAIAADDADDDGGINPREIKKKKDELAKKKKQKEELKKKKQLMDAEEMDDDGGVPQSKSTSSKKKPKENKSKVPTILDDEDEDGGLGTADRLAAEKKKKELEAKKKKQQQEIKTKIQREEQEEDDGGVKPEKNTAAEKKKKEREAQKKKHEEIKAKIQQEEDEDEDGGVKPHDKPPKTKPPKKVLKPAKLEDEDLDDDGAPTSKSYDTVKALMPSKRPVLDHHHQRKSSPPEINDDDDDDGSLSVSKHSREPLLKSYDTVGRMVAKVSLGSEGTQDDSHYDVIPTDAERATRTQTGDTHNIHLIRTTSYREATESKSPVSPRRTTPSSIRSQSKSTEDSSHYSEITDKTTTSSGVINRSYSNTGSIRSASNHSIKHQSKQPSEYTLKQEQQTEESTVESEEEEEIIEKKRPEEKKPLQPKEKKHVPTAFPTISHLVNPEKAKELEEALRKKRACFRWHLAYTIINNYHLFDLRKEAQSRLARLRIERSNLIDEEKQAATTGAPASISTAVGSQPVDIRSRKLRYVFSKKRNSSSSFISFF